jgi:biopolymer transport protein ExbB
MANAPTKPTTPVNKESSSASGLFASLTIPICLIVTTLIFIFVLGDPSHFKGGDKTAFPTDIFGTVYSGGVIVPVIMAFLLMVIVFSIERFVVIGKASGTGSVDAFVRKIQSQLNAGNISGCISRMRQTKRFCSKRYQISTEKIR